MLGFVPSFLYKEIFSFGAAPSHSQALKTQEIPEAGVVTILLTHSYNASIAFLFLFSFLSYNHGSLFNVKLKMLHHKIVRLWISLVLWEESVGICRAEGLSIYVLYISISIYYSFKYS